MADNKLLARLARQHGGRLLDAAIDKLLPVEAKAATGKTVSGSVANAVLAKVALRSVPGAILVGGGILAKRLHDKRKAKKAAALAAAHDTDLLSPESGE
ncbi:MAG: hypothetical protein JSS36_02960 [Proteobacteria bacterium]|nr:hypothetical protein [Pseudomonadota bacterium]